MRSDYLQAAGKPGISITKDTKERFRAGLVLLDAAAANVAEAGAIFAGIEYETWVGLLSDAPAPMRRTLSYVREVGMGTMIPQLATESGMPAQRLRGLPVEQQQALWANPVEMFAPGRTGRAAKYMRFVTEMDSDEIKRAFVRDGAGWKLRSYDEQKSFEAELAAYVAPEKPAGVDRPGRWAVRGGKVYVSVAKASAGLTRRDIETILKDMEEES